MKVGIGLDVGGTKIAGGIVHDDGRVDELMRTPTPRRGPDVLDALRLAASDLIDRAKAAGDEVVGIGVGTGGMVDFEAGRVTAATDLITEWSGTDVSRALSQACGYPVRVDNDGNTFALAEARWGAARECRDSLCVAVGTGVGGGVVIDGQIRRGGAYLAGEFGHLPYPTERRCSCGTTGHVEAAASGPAMTAIYAERSGDVAHDLRAVLARSESGDQVATGVLGGGALALGTALAGIVIALDIPTIVLGGGVASIGESYRQGVERSVNAVLPHDVRADVRLAVLGPHSSVAGAGLLALG